MGLPVLRAWFLAAQRRWPRISWAFDRFSEHVGTDEPRHPEDLFLGGAASERAPQAWQHVELDVRPEVLRRIHRVGRKADSPEDLWQDTVARLMTEDSDAPVLPDGRRPGRIRRYRGVSTLPIFMAVTAKRIALDKLRHAEVGARFKEELAMRDQAAADRTATGLEDLDQASAFAREFDRAFSSLTPTRQALLGLVFGQGMPKAEAGAMLGLRDYQVSRELSAAMESLRMALEAHRHAEWSPQAVEAWTRVWTTLDRRLPGDSDEPT